MDIRKKILSIVGVLSLTMSMGAAVVWAQEQELDVDISTTDSLTVKVNCGTSNAGTGSLSLSAGENNSVTFEPFDPSDPATVSTPQKALRVDVNFGNCPGNAWSVTAAVTSFTSGSNVISSEYFQLPIGEPNSSSGWTSDGTTPAANVEGPSGTVTFNAAGAASTNLASPTGTASGTMYMEFTAQMANIPTTVEDGTYTAEFMVTFNPSIP